MKLFRHIILTLILLSPLCVSAQGSIDNVVHSLENSKSVTNEVYSERRDPSSKAVIKSSRVFNFTDNKIASRIIDAIKKERNKASSFQMNNRRSNAIYTIHFVNSKGLCSKYTLVQHGQSSWVLAIEKYSCKAEHKNARHLDRSEYIHDDAFDMINDLDKNVFQAMNNETVTIKSGDSDTIMTITIKPDGAKTVTTEPISSKQKTMRKSKNSKCAKSKNPYYSSLVYVNS